MTDMNAGLVNLPNGWKPETGILGGLADALNGYMQMDLQTKRQQQMVDYKSQAEASRQAQLQTEEAQKQMQVEKYKNSLQGSIDSNTAEQLAPGMGDVVTNFSKSNGRNPTTGEFKTLFSSHPDHAGTNTNMINPDALGTLLKHQGMDEDEANSLVTDLKKSGVSALPTGIAESYMNRNNKGALPDASLLSLLKDDNQYNMLKTPQEKADYFQQVKASFNEPGKESIQDQARLDKATNAASIAYQAALQNPDKYPNPIAEVGKLLSKRFNKLAVNKVLLHISAINEHDASQQNQQ